MGSKWSRFGDLGGKFRVFLGCLGEEWLGSKGNRFGVFGDLGADLGPNGAGLGCLRSEEQGWGPRGAGLGRCGV